MVWGSICLAWSNLLTARYAVTVLIRAGRQRDMPRPLAGHARETLMSPREGDGAPRSAVRMVSAILFENRGGRLAARHMCSSSEAVAHKRARHAALSACYLQRPYGVGPRFALSVEFRREGRERNKRAQGGRRPVAQRTSLSQLLAGTPSGPGGSSDAARVSCCDKTRERRTSSRRHNASRKRPLKRTRWEEFKTGFGGGDKVLS